LLSAADNHIDGLLKAAFEFLDVNDISSVNKLLDDAAQVHIKKITDVQKRISQGFPAFNNVKGDAHDN
jgi:hypothetical protein